MESLDHIDDMDELFRKAGDDYPLKTGDGEWEKISAGLAGTPLVTLPVTRNSHKKYLGFILLLPLVVVSSILYLSQPDKILDRRFENKKIKPSKQTDRSAGINATVDLAIKARREKQPSVIGTHGTSSAQVIMRNETFSGNRDKVYSARLFNQEKQSLNTVNNSYRESQPHLTSISLERQEISIDAAVKHAHLPGNINFDSNLSNSTVAARPRYNKGGYMGLIVGTGFSKIKSQPLNGTGYNLGLLAGYRFSKKFSLESGVLWTSKKYYTDGKYFNVDKVGPMMPTSMKILGVDGKLTLFEIPVKLKYQLLRNNTSSLFFAAGVTSQVVVKEHNNYLTEMNGVQEHHIGLYTDLSSSFASLIDISAGYEHSFGKSGTIRFEPYIKIPLKKVGMGSIPVFSTGINIGVLKAFRKKAP